MSLGSITEALASHYRVGRELGAGGMAMVYLPHDLKHHRNVAIKVLRPELGQLLSADRASLNPFYDPLRGNPRFRALVAGDE